MVINDLILIENLNIILDSEIIIYGAGYRGFESYKWLNTIGIPVAFFCDSNVQKWGAYIEGTEILSISKLKNLDDTANIVIIIATDKAVYIDQIICVLAGLRLRTEHIYTDFALKISLAQNINNRQITGDNRKAFLKMFNDELELQKLENIMKLDNWQIHAITQSVERSVHNVDNILVYQSGKVGSETISQSLNAIGVPNTHIHFFRGYHYGKLDKDDEESLKKYYSILKNREIVRIITLVREPIERDISLLFYVIGECGFGCFMTPGNSFINSCIDNITLQRIYMNNEFDWFDDELKTVFGIDAFVRPFDKEKGWTVIKNKNIEVLILKLEKLNKLERVIGDFVGAPHFRIIDSNIADSKPYKYLYKQVKSAITLPRKVFDGYYRDPRMAHFYDEEEIAGFYKKWSNNIDEFTSC